MVIIMAKILILSEIHGHVRPLWNSLHAYHDLHFANNATAAMKILREQRIDLIIISVHMEQTNVFTFIQEVKGDELVGSIPVLCFSGERTRWSAILDAHLEDTCPVFGAAKYVTMDSFCGAKEDANICENCPFAGLRCDFNGLRHAMEDMISIPVESKHEVTNSPCG